MTSTTVIIVASVGSVFLFLLCLVCTRKWANGGVNRYKPDLNGQIVVITGANTGLGFITVREICQLNPKMIVLACRNPDKGNDAVSKLKRENGVENIEFMQLDLNDLTSVKQFAQNFNQKYEKLDILINNAGIMALPKKETTAQGFEKQIGVNHLGHFFLTILLLDKIKAAEKGRIVNLSSMAHEMGSNGLDIDDLMWNKRKYTDWDAYAASKLSNIYFTKEMKNKLEEDGVSNVKVCCLHPGVVRTELGRNLGCCTKITMCLSYPFFRLFSKSPFQGAQTQLHCTLMPWETISSGSYYSDCKVHKEKLNKEWAQEAKGLWVWSENAVKEFK